MLPSIDLDECVHVLEAEHGPMEELRAISKSGVQEEAFYVCDLDAVVAMHRQWCRLLPRVQPHYAVKCNDCGLIISTLAALGAGFDCASKAEIDLVLSRGVDRSRIIYAHPAKPAAHIRHAAAVGVNLTTFDNEAELRKLKALHPKCKLVLRIRCDDEGAVICLGDKFGCDALADGPRLLRTAKDLELDVVGVSFHVGSGCRDAIAFQRAIKLAKGVFDAGREVGFVMTLLDIGGGYPGDDDITFTKIANVINGSLDEFFSFPGVTVISEPGCYFVTRAFTLATNVHSKREVINASGDIVNVMYYINDGLYGSFFDVLINRAYHSEPLEAPGDARLLPSSVWGPTCDSMDRVEADVRLPLLDVGAWLVYRHMGNYTRAMACTFNGFPVPRVHAVMSRSTWSVLRERPPLSEVCFVPCITSGRLLSLSRRPAPRASASASESFCRTDQPDHSARPHPHLLTSE